MANSIRTVGVAGTGVIGSSWTGLCLARGLRVLVSDPAPGAEEKLAAYLNSIWPTLEEIGLANNASKDKYRFVGDNLRAHYGDLDFVQENAPEREGLKTALIGEIDAGTRSDVLIASPSSGLPSSQFIGNCKHPERVLFGHPFNPPHLMPLVEVVPNLKTSPESVQTAMSFYRGLGKHPVLVKKEVPDSQPIDCKLVSAARPTVLSRTAYYPLRMLVSGSKNRVMALRVLAADHAE